MSQHDYTIANQGFPATRADINNALSAIATNNSGTSAPSTQYAGQFWIDTTASTWTLYIHDGTDDIQFATIDTSANTVNFIDSELGDNSVTTAKIADGNVTSAKLSYPLTTFSSTGIDDNATSTAITIDSSGNVGISATTISTVGPNHTALQINGTTTDRTGSLRLRSNNGSVDSAFWGNTIATYFGTISNHPLQIWTNSTERMRIDTSGNVGIGTTSPATNLDINGSARVSTGSSYQFGGSDYKIEGSNVTNPRIGFITNSTERMRIDSAGNVGIGTASPAHNVEIVATASGSINDTLQIRNNSGATGTGSRIRFINSTDANSDANGASIASIRTGDDNVLVFETENAERMRIDTNGNVGIDTASPATELDISSGAITVSTKRYITLTSLNASSSEIGYADIGVTFNQNAAGNESGGMNFRCFHSGTMRDRYIFGAGAGDTHAWYTGAGTERMRILSTGQLIVGGTTTNSDIAGCRLHGSGIGAFTRDGNVSLLINRLTNDGNLAEIQQAGVTEGTISVSGTTVSYNGFTGSHWSRFIDESKPDVLRGTVMESLDQMTDWYHAEFETSYTEKDADGNDVVKTTTQKKPYALKANEQEGDVITYAWEKKDEEGNDIIEQVQATIVKQVDVKHVMSKISDTVEAKNVYGVFSAWDNDDLINNDFYVASVGSFVVRIKAGQVVSKGDLLQSNGDGTAKVQADDIIRASTFAKVLSNTVIETYEDGSFIVPCSLMC
jgi:hypothetical protein